MERRRKQTRKQTFAILLVVVAVITAACAISKHRENQMLAYAEANNCEWHYSYYINEQPICK